MSAFRRILVPTDFSPNAREAFRVAHDLASPTGASVVMFHMCSPRVVPFCIERRSSPPEHVEAKDARTELGSIHAKVPAVRIEHEMIVADRPEAKHILRIREERGCDLIVMGTRVHTGEQRRLLGSMTEDVMRGAGCPVILVTAPACDTEHATKPSLQRTA
jgi:nucleotide-binding universal stress UspA family protein